MVNKCCVPSCESNYERQSDGNKEYVHSFKFPNDSELCDKWKKAIPRQNLNVSKHTVVCEKHFDASLIIRFDILPGKDGNPDIKIPRKKYTLKGGAIPSIFPNLPSYLSSTPGPSRETPESKRRRYEEREDCVFQQFLDDDKLESFADLKHKVSTNFLKTCDFFQNISDDFVILFKVDYTDIVQGPKIIFTLHVSSDLSVRIWKNNVAVTRQSLQWILPSGKLERWSQVENILSHYSKSEHTFDKNSFFSTAINLLKTVSEYIEEEYKLLFDFLIEQLNLTQTFNNRRRYSTQCLIFAFCLYFTSPSAYVKARDTFLILPSVRYLRQLCQNITCEQGLLDFSFLKKEVNALHEKDLIVNLLIDEIHVKPKFSYRGEKLIGKACNDSDSLANSIQCFMLSSLMSKNKIIVGMFPVKRMDSDFLYKSTQQVIHMCCKVGFDIVSVISDNNRINRKMFSMLTADSESSFYIKNPVDTQNKIFLLFDSVHLLKSVRNNWLNLKNQGQTFSFPDWPSSEGNEDHLPKRASFSDLKTLYKFEENKLLKQAPTLTWKSLFPHSFERQKVSLALKIFNESNIAALKTLAPLRDDFISAEGTLHFLTIICHWWDIVNVQHQYYGRNKLKQCATPFFSPDDSRLCWLFEMAEWLDKWYEMNKKKNEGFLSLDTYRALKHTLKGLVFLIKYLLSSKKMSFVLTGKFQTDDLEARFGQYRQLSGGNTLISVEEALQSEKKLRISALLKLESFSKGCIPIQEFLTEFSSDTEPGFDESFVSDFPYDDSMDYNTCDNDCLNVVVYVAGYVARKISSKLDCLECCQSLGDKNKPLEMSVDTELLTYFQHLNRGGLVFPTSTLVNVLNVAFSIMNVAVSSMEQKFLSLKNQKKTLIQVNLKTWPNLEFSSVIYLKCSQCEKDRDTIFLMCLKSFINILLNNYSKKLTQAFHDSNASAKKKGMKFK